MGLWPDATPFELDDGVASPAFDDIVRGPSAALTAVALVAGGRARETGWAARAALAVARRWRGPRRPILVDLDLERPALHSLAGVANEEGADDVIAFGLSLGSVTQHAADGLAIVSAGLFAPDPGSVLRSDGWTRVLQEAAARRETLLAWLPADAEGMVEFVRRAGAVMVLAEATEVEAVVRALPQPYAVLAALTPAAGEPGAAAPVATEALPADEPPPQEVPPPEVPPPEVPPDEPPPEEVPPPEEMPPPEGPADEPPAEVPPVDVPPPLEAPPPEMPTSEAPAEPETEAVAEAEREAAEEPLVIAAAADEVLSGGPVEPPEPAAAGSPPAARRLRDEEFEQIRLPKDRESRDALIVELRDRQRAARMVPPPAPPPSWEEAGAADAEDGPGSEHVVLPASGSDHAREMRVETGADDVDLDAIDPGPPAPRRRGYRGPLAWTLLLVLTLSVLAGAWRFLAGRLGWGVAVDAPEPPAAVAEPDAPVVTASAVQEVELPWVVAIEAHTDAARAENRANTLRAGARQIPFHVVPLEREGTRFYHVMAGPVQDSARAAAVRDTLLALRLKTAETPTDIRYAPFAFLVGDYGTRAVAELQIDELLRLDIPAYLVLADAEDGYPLYRVYVGGYAGAGEAEVARQLLREAGVRDSLVTRTGSIVP